MNHKVDLLYQKFLEKILFFEFEPGELINEKKLAEEFKVSRTPIREILIRLELEGLVRIIPRSGSIVTDVDFQKMLHVFQIRLEHEAFIGRLATENILDKQLKAMAEIAEKCLNLFENHIPKELMKIDLEFRDLLYEATGNPILGNISRQLYNLTVRLWLSRLKNQNIWKDEVQIMADEIKNTIAALVSKDAEKAANVRQQYLRDNIERMKSQF